MYDLENLADFVLEAKNEGDFHIRLNFMFSIVVNAFVEEMYKTKKLPFLSHIFIDELNTKLNNMIDKINESESPFADGYLMQDIFLFILKDDFPQYYFNYVYQTVYILN